MPMWVTVCCYCEITTTVNTLMSVFILVYMYRLLLYTVARVGRIYKCFSFDIVAAKGHVSEVRQTLLPWRNRLTEAVQWEQIVYSVSRLRGGEPGTALWCRAACAGRHCGALRRVRAVDAANGPSGGLCSGADRGGS
jgi:hypothetical protein